MGTTTRLLKSELLVDEMEWSLLVDNPVLLVLEVVYLVLVQVFINQFKCRQLMKTHLETTLPIYLQFLQLVRVQIFILNVMKLVVCLKVEWRLLFTDHFIVLVVPN